MGKLAALCTLVAVALSAPARAQEPGVQPVPTLARLCAGVRAELVAGDWYTPSSIRCVVTRRARGRGVEVAALTVTASRLSIDTEVRIAVRDAGGWRLVGTAGLVQLGHGWLGAIEVRRCAVTPQRALEVEVRSYNLESEGAPASPTWEPHTVVCAADGATWTCAER